MGYLRGLKTKIRAEERAKEAIWDRLHEEDREAWQLSHDPNYSEHNGEHRGCFGNYLLMESLSPQCRSCNARDACESFSFDILHYWRRCHADPRFDDSESDDDYRKEMLCEEDYKDWIREQSAEE